MHLTNDTTSYSDRHGWRVLIRLAAVTAVAFALVAASVSAAPHALKSDASDGPDVFARGRRRALLAYEQELVVARLAPELHDSPRR